MTIGLKVNNEHPEPASRNERPIKDHVPGGARALRFWLDMLDLRGQVEAIRSMSLADDEPPDIDNSENDPGPCLNASSLTEYYLNGLPLLRVLKLSDCALNMAHPVLAALDWDDIAPKFQPDRLSEDYYKPGVMKVTLNHLIPEDFLPRVTSEERSDGVTIKAGEWLWICGGSALSEKRGVDRLQQFARELERKLRECLDVRYFRVGGDRSVPPADELVFLSKSDIFEHPPSIEAFALRTRGDQTFLPLAESLVAPYIKYRIWVDPVHYRNIDPNLGMRVNAALADILFLERGYQVRADYRMVVDPTQTRDLREDTLEWEDGDFPILIRLFLEDGQHRKYTFQDVGAGLGYILPLLVALYDDQPLKFLEQPELHLHPALQAAFGDVLLDASRDGAQLVIETHSEHMLLRILRRIRETTAGTLTDPNFRISADDVSVLYFDPSPEGVTRISRIRISSDGDFLDRWPNGFFAERMQELL
jgi:hypothetical protein